MHSAPQGPGRGHGRGQGRRAGARGAAAGREVLANPASTRVSRVAGLARKNVRARYRRFLVEGPQAVREAVRHASDRVLDVYITEASQDRYSEIWEEALAAGLYSHLVSERVMAAMSTGSQGVLAVVAMDESTGSEAH